MKLLALLLPAVALGAVEQVTDQNTFKRILAENPAVVVDFFSQVCDARLLWH
jgi:thioredoxin 1